MQYREERQTRICPDKPAASFRTSVGANIREAFYAHGRADFIAKLQIALKECSESEYWLELLLESGYYDDKSILDQCIEIKKMLIASLNTAKKGS